MGRHSRRGPAPQGSPSPAGVAPAEAGADPDPEGSGGGRRRRSGAGRDQDQDQGRQRAGATYGTPAHGTPLYGTPAQGVPKVRGGHPEQREPGGGWGSGQRYGDWQGAAPGAVAPPRRAGGPATAARGSTTFGTGASGTAVPGTAVPAAGSPAKGKPGPGAPGTAAPGTGAPLIPGPRREFIDAFDADAFDAPRPRTGLRESAPFAPAPSPATTGGRDGDDGADTAVGTGEGTPGTPGDPDADQPARAGKGRALTGIAAAAVTTVLAVVVAGQVTGGAEPSGARPAEGLDRTDDEFASRSDGRAAPSSGKPEEPAPAPATYAELMTRQFPLDPALTASGRFTAVPGLDKAPGKGQKFRYRVDIEDGLGLDGKLFADAVQKTLNDDRSWAHNGAMTFERISGGSPDFVITLASPGTTGVWCAKSGLDTTVDNVSCDSASTDRVMINAFRWAQGAKTFGAKAMLGYRQMLINHEVGHRLGHNHVICRTPGALAPVMQQQTKSLDIDGIKCRPNPWVFPNS
ncbi:DUF3152 domain-containing protein [Streptomyces sp. NPDC059743]|uniref:DUF3152 domain-containing protein n=1 Tax=Streptomyces sp. NPDC059743 TaxID=3346928 RepID=UPI00364E4208